MTCSNLQQVFNIDASIATCPFSDNPICLSYQLCQREQKVVLFLGEIRDGGGKECLTPAEVSAELEELTNSKKSFSSCRMLCCVIRRDVRTLLMAIRSVDFI